MDEFNDQWIVAEPGQEYDGAKYPLQKETYRIIGICMEVHRVLGPGFKEAIYKDALQNEFIAQNISFEREKKYLVTYKGKVLPHPHYADFVLAFPYAAASFARGYRVPITGQAGQAAIASNLPAENDGCHFLQESHFAFAPPSCQPISLSGEKVRECASLHVCWLPVQP